MFDYINEGGCIETYNEIYHLEWLKNVSWSLFLMLVTLTELGH